MATRGAIDKQDIAKPGVLDNILNPLKEFMTMIKEADSLLKTFASNARGGLGIKTDAKGLREQDQLMKQVNSAYQQKIKLDKEAAKAEAVLTLSKKQQQSAEQSLQRQRERGIKQMERERKAAAEANRPYNKLSKTLNDLRKEYRDLAVQGLENTKRGRELIKQIGEQDRLLKKVDADMGVYGRNVGNYTGAIQKGFKSAIGALQQFGLALGGVALAKSAITTIVEFDSAIADLSAITGLAGKDLDFFKENAIKLGVNVKGGAKEVVEAYKLIASAKPELLDNAAALNKVTESAILLSRASGMELPDAATALTDAMNQFGASSDQAAKFVDILAAGAKFGSAEIPQITEALLRFGAVAKTSNVSIQESTALIEALAEKGLKGADAGTALRNVMLKLGAPDALGKDARQRLKALGVNFGDLTDKSKSFAQRLDALKPLLKDNGALVKVFGTENAVAATTLLRTTDRVKELTAAVDENGIAQEQADARSRTVSEAYNRLKETISGLLLEFANGSDAAGGLVDALDFLRENIKTILKVTLELIKAFVIFKTVVKTMAAVDFVKANGGLREMGRNFVSLGRATKEASADTQGFGISLKSIGWTLAIDAAYQLAMEFYNIANGAAQADLDVENFRKHQEQGEKNANARIKKAQKQRDAEIKFAQALRNNGLITEQGLIQQTEKANKRYEKSIKDLSSTTSKKQQENYKQYQIEISRLESLKSLYGETKFDILRTLGASMREGEFIISTNTPEGLKFQAKAVDDLIQKISKLEAQQKGYNKEQEIFTGEAEDAGRAIAEKLGPAFDEYGNALDKNKEKIEDYTMRVRELKDAQINDDFEREKRQLKTKLDSDIAAIKANGIMAYELRIQLERVYEADLLKLQKDYNLKRIEADYEYWDAVKENQKQAKADYEAQLDEEFQQEIKAVSDRDKQLELLGLKSDATDEQLEAAKLERKKESLRQQIEVAKYYGKETLDLELELANLEREQTKKKTDKEKEDAEKLAQFKNNLIRQGTDYLSKQIDKQIELLDKRKQKSQELESYLTEAAANGNIKAEQSIVEQQRIQEEADRKKIELERVKANIVAVGAILQTYSTKTAAGDKNALANTLVESGELFTFLNTLPKYYGGTETTLGADRNAMKPGKDGHLIWADNEERILKPELSRTIPSNVTNDELVNAYHAYNDIGHKYNTGAMMYREPFVGAKAGNSFDIAPLLAKQDEMIRELRSIPSKDMDIDKIAEGMTRITTTKTTPNLVKKSQFIIRN